MNTSSNSSPIDAAIWNRHVAASPHGDVLQCLEWGELKKPDWQPFPVAIPSANSDQFDATCLVLRRAIPRTGRSIFYAPRGPILDWSRSDLLEAMMKQLREAARREKAILIKIDPAVPLGTAGVVESLQGLGFVPSPDAANSFGGTQPRFNMKLDIAGSEAQVQARFHSKWRYNIRLAERKGVRVRQSTSRDDIKIFHDIYRVTAQRDGFVGRPLKYFEKLWDTLVVGGKAQFFVASLEEQALSAAICFVLGRQCWYVYGASSNEHRNTMPNYAMQWAMIQWARERGCELYDFRGVHELPPHDGEVAAISMEELMKSPDGLVRFKAGFGTTLTEYVGEWDLPLDKNWYWAWTSARPRLIAALKKSKQRAKSS